MHTAKSLKEKITSYFHTTKKTSKKNVLACILTLITSLLKSRELGQYFKNSKKNYFVFLISGIMNLYVKRTPDIKNVVFFYRPNSNRSCWVQGPTHNIFIYLIIHIIPNYLIKNVKRIKN